MIIILFKKKQKTRTCSVDGPVIRAHRCTMWKHCDYCCLFLADVVGQHLVLGVEMSQMKKKKEKEKQNKKKHTIEAASGSFHFQFTNHQNVKISNTNEKSSQ